MKKLLFIGFLMYCNGIYSQSKSGWVNINKKDIIPIDNAKIDSAIKSNQPRVDALLSKSVLEKNQIKTNTKLRNTDEMTYWYIVDTNTNKIIDTTVVYNFISKKVKRN